MPIMVTSAVISAITLQIGNGATHNYGLGLGV